MKVRISPADVSAHEMTGWLARLHDEDADARLTGAQPGGGKASDTWPGGGNASDEAPDDGQAMRKPAAPALTAERPSTSACRATRPGTAGRALIGDQLRIPIVWCEIAPCISHHTNPAALGEADIRARALSAGWRFDRLGRLTCPECQQSSPWFWPAHPVVLWDKEAAATMVALMAAYHRRNGADRRNGIGRNGEVAHESSVPPAWPATGAPPSLAINGRHRKQHSP